MNIVNKLTMRHLKQNKRRTLVTIFGVIISVAMIMAVATLSISFLDLMKRQTIAETGEWHVLYSNVDDKQLEAINQDDLTERVIISKDVGYTYLEGGQNKYKPYLFIKEYSDKGFDEFPIELSDGRLPKNENEVVITEHIESNGGVTYEIGDKLTVEIGKRYVEGDPLQKQLGQIDSLQRTQDEITEALNFSGITKAYTIVGKIQRPNWEPTWAPGYTIISNIDESSVSTDNTVNASVVVNKINNSLFEYAEEFAARNGIETVSFNDDLLRYYGVTDDDALRTTLFSLAAIIISIIMIGSVALIYNAFAISVSERARHLGMLSSVGATKKQKRDSVLFEGVVVGLLSIPIGIIAGIIGIGITFSFINNLLIGALNVSDGLKLELTVTPWSILVATGISIITIFISTYIPARKASKISAIDAIRQTQDVKLTGKKVKTSKLVRKLFGMEAEIGLKNLKRNKRRYQVTVFSLVISIILFLAVSFFTDSLQKSAGISQQGINFDIQVLTSNDSQKNINLLHSFTELTHVTDYNFVHNELTLRTKVDEDKVSESFKEQLKNNSEQPENGKFEHQVSVYALDQASFQAYTKSIDVDIQKFTAEENPAAILINQMSYRDYERNKFVEGKALEAEIGDKIKLTSYNFETEKETYVNDVEIAALTDQLPMGVRQPGLGDIILIVSEDVGDALSKDNQNGTLKQLFLTTSDPMATQAAIEKLNETNMHIYNVYQVKQQEEQLMLMLKVFAYGFITLITAISVANIFNTISTSISLRKREFAMLKSIGMTPKGFNKMINYESIFYGMKSLLYGLPISVGIMYLIHRALMNSFEFSFTLPLSNILFVIVAIFIIVGVAMLYSSAKVKKENIIDALKQENI